LEVETNSLKPTRHFKRHTLNQDKHNLIDALLLYLSTSHPLNLVTKNKPPIGVDYIELFEKGIIDRDEARKELGMTMSCADVSAQMRVL
jgi:hypothetical protein